MKRKIGEFIKKLETTETVAAIIGIVAIIVSILMLIQGHVVVAVISAAIVFIAVGAILYKRGMLNLRSVVTFLLVLIVLASTISTLYMSRELNQKLSQVTQCDNKIDSLQKKIDDLNTKIDGLQSCFDKGIKCNCDCKCHDESVTEESITDDGTTKRNTNSITDGTSNTTDPTTSQPDTTEPTTSEPGTTDPNTVHVTGITITPTVKTLDIGDTFNIVASISPVAADDKSITWSSSNGNIATVDSNGKVTAVAAGTVNITAKANDGGMTAVCKVTVVKPIVHVTSITVTPTVKSLDVGDTFNVVASISPITADDKSVTWSSSNGNIATVDSNGKVTAVAAGTVNITAKANDGGMTAVCKVTVVKPIVHVTSITVTPTVKSLDVGDTFNVVASISPITADDKSVTWSSDNTNIATVDSNGKVTAVAAGTVNITAKANDGGMTAVCKVTVVKPIVHVTSITVTPTVKSLDVGDTFNIVASISPITADDKSVTWSSDNTNIATVDSNGKVTAVAAGTVNITAKANDGGMTAVCKVTVVKPIVHVTGITVTPTVKTLDIGDTFNVVASISPITADDKNVTWSSDNTNIVTVDSNGKVTAVAAGTAHITAKANDGGMTATCTVTVNLPAPTITAKVTFAERVEGATVLKATVVLSSATDTAPTFNVSDGLQYDVIQVSATVYHVTIHIDGQSAGNHSVTLAVAGTNVVPAQASFSYTI